MFLSVSMTVGIIHNPSLHLHNSCLPSDLACQIYDLPQRFPPVLVEVQRCQQHYGDALEVLECVEDAGDEQLLIDGVTSPKYLDHLKSVTRDLNEQETELFTAKSHAMEPSEATGDGEAINAQHLTSKVEAGSAAVGTASLGVGQRGLSCDGNGWAFLDRDADETTAMTLHSESTARRSVAATIHAMHMVRRGVWRSAFALTRPPGHHNGCNLALERKVKRDLVELQYACHGGCILNETAIAVKHLQRHGLPDAKGVRVAIVDLDVHFGDGSAWMFYDDATVQHISLHIDQSDEHKFPFLNGKATERGAGKGKGYTVNLPLLPGMGDLQVAAIWKELGLSALTQFRPHFIFVSLGFDGISGDPTDSGIQCSEAVYAHIVADCQAVCRRVVCTVQGGYQGERMARAIAGVLDTLITGQAPAALSPDPPLLPDTQAHIDGVRRELANPKLWWTVNQSFDHGLCQG